MMLTDSDSTPSSTRWTISSRTSSCGSVPVVSRLVPFALERQATPARWPMRVLTRRMRTRRAARARDIDHIQPNHRTQRCPHYCKAIDALFTTLSLGISCRQATVPSYSPRPPGVHHAKFPGRGAPADPITALGVADPLGPSTGAKVVCVSSVVACDFHSPPFSAAIWPYLCA